MSRIPRRPRGRCSSWRPTIAAHHWDKVKCRDMRLMYNLMDLADFEAAAPALHWRRFMAGADISEQAMAELVVTQPSFCTEVGALLTDGPAAGVAGLGPLAAGVRPGPVPVRAPSSTRTSVSTAPCCSGTPELKERWKRGVAAGRGRARRSGRPAVRGAALLARGQAADGRSGRQPHRGLPPLDHRAGLDDGEDEDRGAGQAGQVPTAHRLSEQVAGLLGARGARRRPGGQRDAGRRLRTGPLADQDRPTGGPRGVADDTADGQRLLPPAQERDRLSRPPSCSRRSSTSTPTTRSTTAASVRSSGTRSGTASTTRARPATATARCATGGARRTGRPSRSGRGR